MIPLRLLLLLAVAPAPTPTPSGLAGMIQGADFVFEGTIRRMGAATLPEVSATPQTAVVLVRRMLQAPRGLDSLAGQEITVVLGRPGREGERATFFARGWLYGVSAAVIETHRRDAGRGPRWTAAEIAEARAQNENEDLARHLARADLAVLGYVVRFSEKATRNERDLGREHDPEWMEAVFHVEEPLAGTAAEGELTVLFPASEDIQWFAVPKLKPGQQGILILHASSTDGRGQSDLTVTETPGSTPRQAPKNYGILHPQDFQPRSELERIRTLLRPGHGSDPRREKKASE
jgi:hypothetical protein